MEGRESVRTQSNGVEQTSHAATSRMVDGNLETIEPEWTDATAPGQTKPPAAASVAGESTPEPSADRPAPAFSGSDTREDTSQSASNVGANAADSIEQTSHTATLRIVDGNLETVEPERIDATAPGQTKPRAAASVAGESTPESSADRPVPAFSDGDTHGDTAQSASNAGADVAGQTVPLTTARTADQPVVQVAQVNVNIDGVDLSSLEDKDNQLSIGIRSLYKLIIERSKDITDDKGQDILAQLLTKIPAISTSGNPHVIYLAYISALMLTEKPPRITLAKNLIEQLGIIPGIRSPSVRVFLGLGSFAYVAAFIVFALWNFGVTIPETLIGINLKELIAMGIAGGIGSIVSMMLRLDSFENLRSADRMIPVLIGLFRPIIGASFAIFFYVALSSGIVSIGVADPGKLVYLMLTLSFVAGFSERFAPDLISRIEGQYSRLNSVPAEATPLR